MLSSGPGIQIPYEYIHTNSFKDVGENRIDREETYKAGLNPASETILNLLEYWQVNYILGGKNYAHVEIWTNRWGGALTFILPAFVILNRLCKPHKTL